MGGINGKIKSHLVGTPRSVLMRSTAHGALGIPTKRPRQKKQEAKVSQEGTSDPRGDSITINIVWPKKKKSFNANQETQAAVASSGCRAQNWPALLGSHCRRRTMDGSLLAPRMNSSRESFPRKQEDPSVWPTALGAAREQQEPTASLPRSRETMRKRPHFSARL